MPLFNNLFTSEGDSLPRNDTRNKRRRTESDEKDVLTPGMNADGTCYTGSWSRDDIYWNVSDEANIYIRVFDVVFKVTKEVFAYSECLQKNIDAKRDQNARKGKLGPHLTEEEPYHCMNCTVGQFRSFMWLMHIREASELALCPQEHLCVERLMRISDFLAIYPSDILEGWFERKFADIASGEHSFLDSCSSGSLSLLLNMGINGRKSLKDAVVKKWAERLWNKSAPSVPAIDASEQHAIESLRGVAYYIYTQDMMDRQEFKSTGALMLRADSKLTKEQVTRVYGGYCSLVSMWEQTRGKPIPLDMADGCSYGRHAKCASVWEKRWLSAIGWRRIMQINSADILALQACLRDQLMNDEDLKESLHPACRLLGLESMKAMRSQTEANLAEHFSL